MAQRPRPRYDEVFLQDSEVRSPQTGEPGGSDETREELPPESRRGQEGVGVWVAIPKPLTSPVVKAYAVGMAVTALFSLSFTVLMVLIQKFGVPVLLGVAFLALSSLIAHAMMNEVK